MNSPLTTTDATVSAGDVTQVQSHYASTKKLGHWTTSRRFEFRGRRGSAVLDLRSPQIPPGDIELVVDMDHSMLKLLVPEGAVIDHWDLHWTGRGKVKQTFHETASGDTGRRIRITGHVKHGEVRVHSGGVAQLSAMFSREYVDDAIRAHRDGDDPTVDDPTRPGRTTRAASTA
jgi:hypothetical protein